MCVRPALVFALTFLVGLAIPSISAESTLGNLWDSVKSGVKDSWHTLTNSEAASKVKDTVDTLKDNADKVTDKVTDGVKDSLQTLSNVEDKVVDTIKDGAGKILEKSGADDVQEKAKEVFEKIAKI